MHGTPRRRLKFKPGTAELADEEPSDAIGNEIAADALAQSLGSFAEIRMPRDAEEPILAPRVRAVMLEWMTEIRCKEELAAAKVPLRHTALLFGPPGCGKTTLAHHLAARLGMPLVIAEAAAIETKWMGETAGNILKFFNAIRLHEEPVVVLLDEIDSLGGKRVEADRASGVDVNRTVNALLTQIEKFDGLLLAATNRQDALDSALWRRFGMQISVDLPGDEEAFAILKRYSMPFQFHDDLLDMLVMLTKGASPSLLRQLMEGIKRSLILGPRLKRQTDDPVKLVATVASSIAPPPEYDPAPPLWSKTNNVKHLADMPWPPKLETQ
jgi:SpoVK/Ycf46/Vps4 family AAA+-type ATPase